MSNVLPSPSMAIPKTRGERDSDSSFGCDSGFSCDECLENFELFARHEFFSIEKLSQSDWRRPIIEYLENLSRNTDRKIKYRALSYAWEMSC